MIWTKAYRPFALLLVLDTAVALLDKIASTHGAGQGAAFYGSLIGQPWLWLALAVRPLQLIVWTRILRRTDLSFAYCVTSLCYPVTMVCAVLLFHEHLPAPVWIGAALITLGVASLAAPEPEKVS